MIKRFCDRCGAIIPQAYTWSQVQFPMVEIAVRRGLHNDKRKLDLCQNCAQAVVDLVFEAEEDPADEGED